MKKQLTNTTGQGLLKKVLVYVHYNKNDGLSDYVLYQLEKLQPYYTRIIILSNTRLTKLSRSKLEAYTDEVIQRENIGFDFAAWRDGILAIGWDELNIYDELTLMNDTCFGPTREMSTVYQQFAERSDVDFWGITNHREETHGMPGTMTDDNPLGDPIPEYIQTYFITFKNNVIRSEVFRNFWSRVENKTDLKQAIIHYETQLTQLLHAAGYNSDVLVETKDIKMPNYALFHNACLWTPDILLPLSPFIKKKAFVRNKYASQLVLPRLEKINYPVSYIIDYIRTIDEHILKNTEATLIVLRGNSGSGKTTIAKRLKQELFYGVMVIGWDMLRIEIFNRFDYVNRDEYVFNSLKLLSEYGKKNNLTVILEGIYPAKQYRSVLNDIAGSFPKSYFYYFDISFEELVRRHETRNKQSEFGVDELRKWYIPEDKMDVPGERLIDEKMNEDEIIAMIVDDLKKANG